MTIKTERLMLRPLTMKDLATTHAYTGDTDNTRYMMFQCAKTLEDTETFVRWVESEWAIEHPVNMEFAVCLNGEHIGGVSIEFLSGDEEVELGWVLGRPYQGKGFAAEAASALMHYSASVPGIQRVIAHCDTRNRPSSSLMKRLGMHCVGEGERVYSDERGTAREYTFSISVEEIRSQHDPRISE